MGSNLKSLCYLYIKLELIKQILNTLDKGDNYVLSVGA